MAHYICPNCMTLFVNLVLDLNIKYVDSKKHVLKSSFYQHLLMYSNSRCLSGFTVPLCIFPFLSFDSCVVT